MAEPSIRRYEQLYEDGKKAGLTDEAAYAYAVLMWWGLWYQITPAKITSGRRSRARQAELYRQDPRNAAPPGSSKHETGRAFDISDNGAREIYGFWAPFLGLRWGQNFAAKAEPWHFDLG